MMTIQTMMIMMVTLTIIIDSRGDGNDWVSYDVDDVGDVNVFDHKNLYDGKEFFLTFSFQLSLVFK